MFGNVYYEIAAVLALAIAVSIVAVRFSQPLIIAFLIVGVVVGPAGLSWVTATDEIEIFASIGIAILLFVVGLKLDVGLIKSVGPVALATGLGQVVFTSGVGFLIALALGISLVPAVYVAVALTFSSTIIIVKLLSDKREIDSLHGRIAVGFLIVQDICVVIAMVLLSGFSAGGETDLVAQVLRLIGVASAFLIGTAVLMRWVMPPLMDWLATSQELLVLFAIVWAVGLAAIGDGLGFSKEVGAFLGGVSIASTRYRDAIASRLVSLRDFLLLFFFIDLGARLDVSTLGGQLAPAIVLSLFVLIGNPLIVMVIMGFMGYRRRTSLLAGLTVAQISEFSLILAALGVRLGHVGSDTSSLITLVGIITIALSTYLIMYSGHLYELLKSPLKIFERAQPFREIGDQTVGPVKVDVIVLGLGRYGSRISDGLAASGFSVLGVDFDPQALSHASRKGIATQYGDASDPESASALPLSSTRLVLSTLPAKDVNHVIAHALQSAGFAGIFVATAHSSKDAKDLQAAGASMTLLPFRDAADQAVDLITEALQGSGPFSAILDGEPRVLGPQTGAL
ncbi:MAG: sodium:proton exchanger [Actinobacteria bacterium HGW-Actinobacteria-10]|nr:MAG: sodium:proton exchanger [Actinobacteria bacterium HGW-Actinobacteria-10]